MHDKVSVVDRFSFWFSSRNSFQEAKSIVLQTSIVFRPNVGGGGGGAEVSEEPHLDESDYQILWITKSHLKWEFLIIIYKSFSARIIELR